MPVRDRLTDLKCKQAKPGPKTQRLFDGAGLYLELAPSGGKWWRFKYRHGDKEKRISLGVYPEVTLKEARERRDDARKQVASGADPSTLKKAQRASALSTDETFEKIAREWVGKQAARWPPSHQTITLTRLESYVFPWHGKQHIRASTAPELLVTLRRLEDRGAVECAHRVRQICAKVFAYAIAIGCGDRNPAADLRGALPPVKPTHVAALTDPGDVGELLRAVDGYAGNHVTRSALRISPLVFLRPGELRTARWDEFDLNKAEWNIAVPKMKMRHAHLVPLSTQAVAILRDLEPLTQRSEYVFPSVSMLGRPMSNNTVLAALRMMGYSNKEVTGHGFRAMACTILDEVLGPRPEIIEHQLAHKVKDHLGRAYNRTQHPPERRAMMKRWADYLDGLRAAAPAKGRRAA